MTLSPELEQAIKKYCELHQAEYNKEMPESIAPLVWSYQIAKKFVKVLKSREGEIGASVHCFIQIEDEKQWKAGDIFKPASWKGPQKNFSRGNVLVGNYHISIYGI